MEDKTVSFGKCRSEISRLIRFSLFVCALCLLNVGIANAYWEQYTNVRTNSCLEWDGQYLYTGTPGGLLRWTLAPFGQTPTYKKYTSHHGLPQGEVVALAFDPLSSLLWGGELNTWDCTRVKGTFSFNGSTESFKSYTTVDGLSSNCVYYSANAVAVDALGRIWFGTNGYGLNVFSPTTNTWTVYNTSNSGIIMDDISAIAFDSSNNAWIGSGGMAKGLNKFDGTNWFTYTSSDSGLLSNLRLIFSASSLIFVQITIGLIIKIIDKTTALIPKFF
jgi:ligand-binding sensor domain-containing protein